MKNKLLVIAFLTLAPTLWCQNPPTKNESKPVPPGKWLDTMKEVTAKSDGTSFYIIAPGQDIIASEDYEVAQTHEVCATLTGFFRKASQQGRYEVRFHGLRTSREFEFTTQYAAEHWAEYWCTPQSLLLIKKSNLSNYW